MTVTEILKQLVSIDTTNPPGNEAELAAWIAEYLETYGFSVEQPECGKNRKSILAKLSFGEGPKLVFNGHLDVVPAGDGWETQPFLPVIRGTRMYGRGTADMKGGVAAMIAAATGIACNHPEICGELCLNFVADEEIINLGTHSCKYGWQDADYVVIGEPTEMQIAIAHKGTARFKIIVYGKSCHSGMPWDGINAIEKAAKVILAMRKFDDSLKEIQHPFLSRPSISLTMIMGGEKDNIIPGLCEICVDYRMIPGDTGDSVEQKLCRYLKEIEAEDSEFQYKILRYINLEPGEISSEHKLVKTAQAVFENTMHKPTSVRDFPATCEQVLFTKEGIPTIIIGPGSIRQAHVSNEFIEIEELEAAAKYYEALAREILGANCHGK